MEKLEAIVSLGIANSRMKDFYDLDALIREGKVDRSALQGAIDATFVRRGTTLRIDAVGLSDEFGVDRRKVTQWRAFTRKNELKSAELLDVVRALRRYIEALPH